MTEVSAFSYSDGVKLVEERPQISLKVSTSFHSVAHKIDAICSSTRGPLEEGKGMIYKYIY